MQLEGKRVVITGGAGYIGSLLTGRLLRRGYKVTVVDDLHFGVESLLSYFGAPGFLFVKGNVCHSGVVRRALKADPTPPMAVVHLAAIVGFPACQKVGQEVAWRYNVEATQTVFETAEEAGVERFVFSSTYSVYGLSQNGTPVDETSPLYPQSLYAETKIAAEEYLLGQGIKSRCAPIICRFSTLFGISPRTRFDLIINQFVLEALIHRKLVIYQCDYARSFIHVRDVCSAVMLALETDLNSVQGEIFNVGADKLSYTKDEIVAFVQQEIAGTAIEYKDLSFAGDMRDIRVSFQKIQNVLGFEPEADIIAGIREVRDAVVTGLIKDPTAPRSRNAPFIVQ